MLTSLTPQIFIELLGLGPCLLTAERLWLTDRCAVCRFPQREIKPGSVFANCNLYHQQGSGAPHHSDVSCQTPRTCALDFHLCFAPAEMSDLSRRSCFSSERVTDMFTYHRQLCSGTGPGMCVPVEGQPCFFSAVRTSAEGPTAGGPCRTTRVQNGHRHFEDPKTYYLHGIRACFLEVCLSHP